MIVLDVDGVLADFVTAAIKAHGRSEKHDEIKDWNFYENWGLTAEQFWAKCKGREFWMSIEPYPEAVSILRCCEAMDETILCTSPSNDDSCPGAKLEWIRHWFGITPDRVCVTGRKAIFAHSSNILIDDSIENLSDFSAAGGFVLGWPRPWNNFSSINTLALALNIVTGGNYGA